ncbi:hypothetical protein K9N68_27085 [Kovacikia minuta CCNUW1]|uniref:hypothetical protein n=1 Tax=Kovacikia minuta TaxID=2931930 RepID=UPI001CCE4296|nr:hypothetical protein [Kovacikia minuta]UBF25247.1 hypothetical protein K9N68_27085 [Kovacikia minuta CCNUW1]
MPDSIPLSMVTTMFKRLRSKRLITRSIAMQKILAAAKLHQGRLSACQAAVYSGLNIEEVSHLLDQATKGGYAKVAQDEKSGIVWVFPIMVVK